jgi:ubiquinone/menaquinone biosynthesis C-methylase UbiE
MTNDPRGGDREIASRRLFDRWARSYDRGRISGWFQYTQQLAIDNLVLEPDSRVLDVGCGTGHATLTLAPLLPDGLACGMDISSAMVAAARGKTPGDIGDRVGFIQASSAALPYGDERFDHVMCTNSFHHYPDPLGALTEMRRVLRPGGQLVIFENAPDLSFYAKVWDRVLRLVEKGHVRYYASQELGEMITRSGFGEVELRVLRNEFLKYGKLFASIQLWSAKKAGTGVHA